MSLMSLSRKILLPDFESSHRGLRLRVLTPLVLGIFLLQTVFIFAFYLNQRNWVKNNKDMTAERLKNLFQEAISNDIKKMGATLELLIRNPFLTQAFQEQNINRLNIHEGIDSTLIIFKHRLKANENRSDILVIKHYSNLPLIPCYPGQLNQVFMNLLANAIDAIDEQSLNHSYQEMQNHPHQITIATEIILALFPPRKTLLI